MWLSEKNLSSLKKYRSGLNDENNRASTPPTPDTNPDIGESSTATPETPIRQENPIRFDDDPNYRTPPHTPPRRRGSPEGSESLERATTEKFDNDRESGVEGLDNTVSQHPATNVYQVHDVYSSFMRKLSNTNKQLFNSFGNLYSKMRCQLTDCMALSSTSVSNSLRQDGKFLIPKGVKVDEYSQKYVAIVTLKKINIGSTNEEDVTKSIEIVKGDEFIKEDLIKNKEWIKFIKNGDIITVPWCPSHIPKDVNDWTIYQAEQSIPGRVGSDSCIRISIQDNEGVKCADLSSFMYEHMHCMTTLKNAKHRMDAIKSLLYNCDGIKYMHLTDATYDISEKDNRKHTFDSIISKKVRTLLTKKSTVYKNYGFLPYQNDGVEFTFRLGTLPTFLDQFIVKANKFITNYQIKIKEISENDLKTWFEEETEKLKDALEGLEQHQGYFENENGRTVKLFMKVFWENDECWIEATIFKFSNDGSTILYKNNIEKGRYVDIFKLLIEPMIDNIASQPSVWYDDEKELISDEKNTRRLTTVKDVIEKAVEEFKKYNSLL